MEMQYAQVSNTNPAPANQVCQIYAHPRRMYKKFVGLPRQQLIEAIITRFANAKYPTAAGPKDDAMTNGGNKNGFIENGSPN